MKKILILLSAIIICSCSSSSGDDSPKPSPTPTDDGKPIAVNDTATTPEDTELTLSNLLNNDTVVDNASISAFDATTSNGGTVSDERTSYLYTPAQGFAGEDTFTYTLCDDDSPANCSTATVTITVTDEGNPVANDDAYNVLENSSSVFTELLINDDIIDGAILSSIDNSTTQGTVTLNSDNTVTYTPQNGFLGDDSFKYTICDDDSPNNSCSTATVSITVIASIQFNIPAELSDYYSGITFTDDAGIMFDNLEEHTIENHTTILSYGQRHQYLYNADADLSNSDNVILMYSSESRYWEEYTSGSNPYSPQTFNTEHVYPQSFLNSSDAVTDLHHLRVCDASVNSNRLNYPFTNGSGTYQLIGETWYPGDEWRGDVARMLMYLNIRYGETFSNVGGLDLFIAWNIADPVSAFEIQRNEVIYAAQGNRNPFIDNPYLATLVWGGAAAENKWE
ncbi:MAG: cadherin-like domain-containing protein [Flaviramulus sp.]|nr:endonuclease [Flaviramulus sp.]NNC49417.1 cadherin-like domain-containing protein [Flaviramulus sp.]